MQAVIEGLGGVCGGLAVFALAWWLRWEMGALSHDQHRRLEIREMVIAEPMPDWKPQGGWYAWEAGQYRATKAPWFDPRRYDGSGMEYPEPTTADHFANYRNAETDAFRRWGKKATDQATWWVVSQCPPEWRGKHMAELDPIGWCVARWQEAGSPKMDVPRDWSPSSPERGYVQ